MQPQAKQFTTPEPEVVNLQITLLNPALALSIKITL